MITKASRFALYALVEMARAPDRRFTAAELAERNGISQHHLAKVLAQLQRRGWVEGQRGPSGGYRLAVDPGELTMADVVELVEGPLGSGGCAVCAFRGSGPECTASEAACRVHDVITEIETGMLYTLRSITIATLARPRGARTVA